MGRNITNKLTKNYILSKVDQITIFSVYFNLPIETIQYCIDTGEFIVSPLRSDLHPTCGFRYDNRGKLKFKDFAGYFWGDCFDAAAYILSNIDKYKGLDVNSKDGFITVLRHITFTFKDLKAAVDMGCIYLSLTAGALYTVGAIFYGIGKKHKYMHSIFHLFVLSASILFFFAIFLYVI